EVLEGLNLTKSKYPLFRRLDFDVQTKKYKWTVQNTLFKGKNHGKMEYLEIDPVSGKILIRKEIEYINTW
uniref:hypothetical protein n=1 Tax=uncultured Carboxylicivirga sp. TaxID=1628156 RepID=UPI0025943AF7